MKGLFTFRALAAFSFIFSGYSASAQPDYSFNNAVLESGTALQTGAVYKFSLVKTGVDARITIMGSAGNVTLSSIDENWTGFDEAFQPFINVGTNANGYVEFKVEFYLAATTTKVTQTLIPVTCIDVDGKGYENGVLYEQDQVQFFPGYYDFTMTGGNLLVTNLSSWVIIKNTSGISYPGIDTMAKDVMATVVNRNVSSFLLRIGALNTSSTESEVRYRSVYFKKFNYGHPEPLALKTIMNLSGSKKQDGVELKVLLAQDHSFNQMVIERSASSSSLFSAIGEMDIVAGAGSKTPLAYFDANAGTAANYYRVRLINTQNGKEELSNTLMIKADGKNNSPEITTSFLQPANPMLTVRCQQEGEANLQVFDMWGRSITKTKVRLNSGYNSISLPSFNAGRGYLLLVLETKNNPPISRKVLVQYF